MNGSPAGSARARALGLLVSAAFVAAVVWWALQQRMPAFDASPEALGALAGAVALYALNTILRGERWHALLRKGGGKPARADSYALTAVGYMGNNVLPARAGDVMRVVLMSSRAGLRRLATVGTLVAERLLDVAVLAVLFVVIGYAVVGDDALPGARTVVLVAAAAGAILAVAAGAVMALRPHVRKRLFEIAHAMARSTLALRDRHGAALVAFTAGIWLVEAGVWLLSGVAAGLALGPLEAIYLVALASLFSMIPSGPGYAGTQDAAIVLGVTTLGGSGPEALLYLVLVRSVLIGPITLTGFAILLTRYGGWWRARVLPRLEENRA